MEAAAEDEMSFEQRAGVAKKLENLVGRHARIKHERCERDNREKGTVPIWWGEAPTSRRQVDG
jgi:hypothetical protein